MNGNFSIARLTDGKAKNISLDHTNGKLQGTSATGERAARLAAMIERFGAGATRFVERLLPRYAGLERARTSFRPVEVEDRPYSVIQDDRLLHIDAFPSRPMQEGRRILRFFANVAPRGSPPLGSGRAVRGFRRADSRRACSRIRPARAGCWAQLGVTRGRRSRYDEMMLSLHDAAKRDAQYQKDIAACGAGIPARLLLAGLYRPGAARRAGRRIRAGADLPSRYRARWPSRSARRSEGAGTADGQERWLKRRCGADARTRPWLCRR